SVIASCSSCSLDKLPHSCLSCSNLLLRFPHSLLATYCFHHFHFTLGLPNLPFKVPLLLTFSVYPVIFCLVIGLESFYAYPFDIGINLMSTIDAKQPSRLAVASARERGINRMIAAPTIYPALEWCASWSGAHVARDFYQVNVIVIHSRKLACYGHRLYCSANKHVHVCLYRPLSACSIHKSRNALLCPSCRYFLQCLLWC